MSNIYTAYYHSPIGLLELNYNACYLLRIQFAHHTHCKNAHTTLENGVIQKSIQQLKDYFSYQLTEFDLPLLIDTTPFAKEVYALLQQIPYGTTQSYKQIAEKTSHHKAYRAVGNINNKNPLLIVIPCHRVIGSNGKLVGYGGGLAIKKWLLDHEKECLKRNSTNKQ